MQATLLVRIATGGAVPPTALRALLTAARRARRLPGFMRWQTFRALDSTGDLLVVLDWASEAGLWRAVQWCAPAELLDAAAASGFAVAAPRMLSPSFDRRLSQRGSVATLLRVSHGSGGASESARRDNELALQALAAPGSIRLYGARELDPKDEVVRTAICRIDFNTEDGVWHFIDSPLRKAWSSRALGAREEEVWALNLPRLGYERASPAERTDLDDVPGQVGLSVDLTVSEDGSTARLRFFGRVDRVGSQRCDRLCRALMENGCSVLEVDVCGLTSLSSEALVVLTHAARGLKSRGGQFVLIDQEERVKLVTRMKHLETSVR